MKTWHKAMLTFAITAMSTLPGSNGSSRIQALLDETYAPAASITTTAPRPVGFQNLRSKPAKKTREPGRNFLDPKKYAIPPVAFALSQPSGA
jgi:hypothetical protein